MAYLLNQDEEDQDLLTQAGQAQLPTGAQAAAAAGTAVTNPSTPDRFVNFSSYFNANSNAANTAGNNLVQGLDTRAADAQSRATTGAQDLTKKAQQGTLTGPGFTPAAQANAGGVVDVGVQTPGNQGAFYDTDYLKKKSGETYQGPTTGTVESYFTPVLQDAGKASRDINTAQDAAGVRALQGGTGFDAALTSAAAGGRKGALQQQYAGLGKTVQDSARGAWDAADKAATDSKTATKDWEKWFTDVSGKNTEAQDARDVSAADAGARDWDMLTNAAWAYSGAKPLKTGRTAGTRPTGNDWSNSVYNTAWWNTSSGANGKAARDFAARVYDKLTDDEAKYIMRIDPVKSKATFNRELMRLAQEHGVK